MKKHSDDVIVGYNQLALEQIKESHFENAVSYLKQALILLKQVHDEENRMKLMAMTCSNLGGLFFKMKEFEEAIKYLEKTIEISRKTRIKLEVTAETLLNLSLSYTEIRYFEEALDSSATAISKLKLRYIGNEVLTKYIILAHQIAGNAYKSLDLHKEAEEMFRKGWELGKNQLGIRNELTLKLKRSLGAYTRGLRPWAIRAPSSTGKRPKSQETSYIMRAKQSFFNPFLDVKFYFSPQLPMYEEEQSAGSYMSTPKTNSARKIDLERFKSQEKSAAVRIQAWWRGIVARREFLERKIDTNLKRAEMKARKAVEEYDKLKRISEGIKRTRVKH
jgi:tetratricopeptide (TPR) repeat protein